MYKVEDMLEDDLDDSVARLTKKLNKRTAWTKKSEELRCELISELEKRQCVAFRGNPQRYHLHRIGQSCLFDVPSNRRGHLKQFRGKRVRIICLGSGRFDRDLVAGVVPKES